MTRSGGGGGEGVEEGEGEFLETGKQPGTSLDPRMAVGGAQSQDQTQGVSGKPPSLSFPFCEMGVTVALPNRVSGWPKGGEGR